jgi:hypothetical protein
MVCNPYLRVRIQRKLRFYSFSADKRKSQQMMWGCFKRLARYSMAKLTFDTGNRLFIVFGMSGRHGLLRQSIR